MNIPLCMRSKQEWEKLIERFKFDSFIVKAEILHPLKNNLFCIQNDK